MEVYFHFGLCSSDTSNVDKEGVKKNLYDTPCSIFHTRNLYATWVRAFSHDAFLKIFTSFTIEIHMYILYWSIQHGFPIVQIDRYGHQNDDADEVGSGGGGSGG